MFLKIFAHHKKNIFKALTKNSEYFPTIRNKISHTIFTNDSLNMF